MEASLRNRYTRAKFWGRLVGLIVIAGGSSGARDAAAQQKCTVEHTYIGNRPKEANVGWHEEAQGIAHDRNDWFITQKSALWKIPGTRDIGSDVECGEDDVECKRLAASCSGFPVNPFAQCTGLPCARPSDYPELWCGGFDHFGDLTEYESYLCVPVEFRDKEQDAIFAFFRASDLELVATVELPEQDGTAGWCAVDENGTLYSSGAGDAVSEFFRYELDWSTIESLGILEDRQLLSTGKVLLRDEGGAALGLPVMQGVAFSDDGLLYAINGDAINDCDACGIHVFDSRQDGTDAACGPGPGDCVATRIDRSQNGVPPFDYQYNPGSVYNREEPEGITVWDLTAPGAPAAPGITSAGLPVAISQLHALMLDNDITSADDIYVKHYTIDLRCEPAAGIVVSPLAFEASELVGQIASVRSHLPCAAVAPD